MNEAIGYVRVSSEEHIDNGLASKTRLHRAKVAARVIALLVTTGKRSSTDERGGWWLPRKQLAATLLVLLQSRQLRVPGITVGLILAADISRSPYGDRWARCP